MNINLNLLKELKQKTNMSLNICKNALIQTNNNLEKAYLFLLKNNLENKRNSKQTNEGIIFSYIHPGSKLGILLKIKCETDFVAKQLQFKELAKNICLHLIANTNIKYININNISLLLKYFLYQKKLNIKLNKNINFYYFINSLKKYSLEYQSYLYDNKLLFNQYFKSIQRSLDENIKILNFIIYKI